MLSEPQRTDENWPKEERSQEERLGQREGITEGKNLEADESKDTALARLERSWHS